MSLTHKFLDISDHEKISNEIHDYFYKEIFGSKSFKYYIELPISRVLPQCPELKKFLNDRYLIPTLLAIIVCDSKDEIAIHRDNDGSAPFIRILWPIKNCEGSKTRFWSMPEGSGQVVSDSNGVVYTQFINTPNKKLIDEFELTSPVLLNVSIPHSVHPNPEHTGLRISFSMGFDRDLPISKSIRAWFGIQY